MKESKCFKEKQVTSTWDTGIDGKPRRGLLILDCGKEGGIVRWENGEEDEVGRSDIIIHRGQRR